MSLPSHKVNYTPKVCYIIDVWPLKCTHNWISVQKQSKWRLQKLIKINVYFEMIRRLWKTTKLVNKETQIYISIQQINFQQYSIQNFQSNWSFSTAWVAISRAALIRPQTATPDMYLWIIKCYKLPSEATVKLINKLPTE